MILDATGVILAGGQSSRMGQDKARMDFLGQTLLARAVDLFTPMFAQVIVSVREPRADCVQRQIKDEGGGPLAGLAAGLAAADTPWVFVMACDMPFVSRGLIEYLATMRSGYDAVVPVAAGYPQPLAAFYATYAEKIARELVSGADRSLKSLLGQLRVNYVDAAAMPAEFGRCFFDLDTPEDVALAIKMGLRTWNI